MINQIIIFGRLTADPELKATASGKAICNFRIANDTGAGDKKKTYFFSVTAFDRSAELVTRYFKQGSLIGIRGRLTQSTYQAKDGTNRESISIALDEIQFTGGPVSGEGSPSLAQAPARQPQSQQPPQQAGTYYPQQYGGAPQGGYYAPPPQGWPQQKFAPPAQQQSMTPPPMSAVSDDADLPF